MDWLLGSGVCDLGGRVYCVGGWNGQYGMRQCNVLDPQSRQWSDIAPLNFGRYQAAVTATSGKLYAVGGCDTWNCLNTVEVYDPELNAWDSLPPLNTARRGCGVAFYQSIQPFFHQTYQLLLSLLFSPVSLMVSVTGCHRSGPGSSPASVKVFFSR